MYLPTIYTRKNLTTVIYRRIHMIARGCDTRTNAHRRERKQEGEGEEAKKLGEAEVLQEQILHTCSNVATDLYKQDYKCQE